LVVFPLRKQIIAVEENHPNQEYGRNQEVFISEEI